MKEFLTKVYQLLQNDKTQHFVFGLAIASLVFPFSPIAAVAVATAVGFLKELIDSKGYGTFSRMDALVTAAGGAFLVLWYAFAEILKGFF